MPFGNFLSHSGNSDKIAGTSINCPIGNATSLVATAIGILAVAKDNASAVDGDNNEVISVTDTKGNLWNKAIEFCNSQGAANAGATVAIWWSKITTTLTVGVDSVTANFSSSVTASAAHILSVDITSGHTVAVEASTTLANDGADPGSMDLTVENIEHLWVRAVAHERPSTDILTKTAAYLFAPFKDGTIGSGAASNMTVGMEMDIFTGTSNPSDPSWDNVADEASVLVAFKELTYPGWYGNIGGWF